MAPLRKATLPLRTGIVGAGLMGQWHSRFIRRAGGAVVAVVDQNESAARRLAARLPSVQVYPDAAAMIRDAKVSIVHICTPLGTHGILVEQFLEAGIHTLVEKPLTADAAETDRLLDLAVRNDVLLCPVHQFAFQSGVLEAQEGRSRLGDLRHIELVFCSAGGVGRSPQELDAIVADILPHPLSLLLRFVQEGAWTQGWHCVHPLPGELRASWHNVEKKGESITASIVVSMSARPTRCSLRLIGTAATTTVDLFHGYAYQEPGTVSRQRKIIAPFAYALGNLSAATINLGRRSRAGDFAYPGLRTLITRFYDAVRLGGEAPLSQVEIKRTARLRDDLMKSAQSMYSFEAMDETIVSSTTPGVNPLVAVS